MTTTDYDAPRRSTIEADHAQAETLAEMTTARAEAQSSVIDLDADAGESLELPGTDLSGEELVLPVVPKRGDEFTCTSCFLVQHRSRICSPHNTQLVCIDCG